MHAHTHTHIHAYIHMRFFIIYTHICTHFLFDKLYLHTHTHPTTTKNLIFSIKIIFDGYGKTRIQTTDEIGRGIREEVNLRKYWRDVLGKYTPNSYRSWTTIIGEGIEDIYLTSESRELELERAWHNLRVDKGNLALNKKEKKKKEQSSHPLRIKCTAIT